MRNYLLNQIGQELSRVFTQLLLSDDRVWLIYICSIDSYGVRT